MDGHWSLIFFTSTLYVGSYMSTIFKGYLLIIGITSCVMGLWAMLGPNFVSWYPAFDGVERYTPLANFIRTMSGVFVASGYILIRFIFFVKDSFNNSCHFFHIGEFFCNENTPIFKCGANAIFLAILSEKPELLACL